MITTGCEGCCFLQQKDDKKRCALNQLCCLKDGKAFAPGYCRFCRSNKWRSKQETTNIKELCDKVIDERIIKMDMLIIFDESHNCIQDLEYTLNSDWYIKYAQKIIIVDVTGFGDRKNLALQYIKSKKHLIPTIVDSSVVHESINNCEETIRRIVKKVTSPFFLVIPAGRRPLDFSSLAQNIQYTRNRVIHWSFPIVVGNTLIVPNKLYYGLFITIPYKTLMKSHEVKSFTDQLKKEENETGMGLSWLCEHCWIT